MNPHDPYVRLAAPRRPVGGEGARPGGAALAVAGALLFLALVLAVFLPLGPHRAIDKLLRVPSVSVAEER